MKSELAVRRRQATLSILLFALLLCAALSSGFITWRKLLASASEWRTFDVRQRREALYGGYGPVLSNITRQIPEDGNLLLFSEFDPALLPYYLYPRKIWQVQVDPEINALFMDLPPSSYPLRATESFPAEWVVRIDKSNVRRGGEIYRKPGLPGALQRP